MTFSLEQLRRWPDVEAPNLFAVDASDRLILDEAAVDDARADEIVTIGDSYGALTLGSGAERVFQDSIVSERALAANAEPPAYRNLPLGDELLRGARVVLLKLPRGLAELDEQAAAISHWAADDVRVYAGGRIKHMTTAMNEVLLSHFERVDITHARQKSRVLVASGPRRSALAAPQRQFHADLDMWVCATGATFAGTKLDIGTRALLAELDHAAPDASAIVDLGCGSGVVAAVIARARPGTTVLASDVSAGAVMATALTAEANGLTNITVLRDDALSSVHAASQDLVLLNPPFHLGATVHTGAATKLFAAAARVLRPGGELLTVFNSHLGYRPELERAVGATSQLSRTEKFTVVRSVRRDADRATDVKPTAAVLATRRPASSRRRA